MVIFCPVHLSSDFFRERLVQTFHEMRVFLVPSQIPRQLGLLPAPLLVQIGSILRQTNVQVVIVAPLALSSFSSPVAVFFCSLAALLPRGLVRVFLGRLFLLLLTTSVVLVG